MAGVTTDSLVGRLVDGRYLIVSRIARGGMATVYLAVDQRLDREVALKVMHPHLADGDGAQEFVARFQREARSTARLAHPGIVAVFDQGTDGDTSYLAMEYVNGSNLRHLISTDGTVSVGRTLEILASILDALGAAHRSGLIHRDIKPENVLIDTVGRIKVADFGLTRAVDESTAATTGTVLGTVAYLSPELISTGRCDVSSDVYAVGILAYEMLTGTVPHQGNTPIQVAFQHVHDDVPPPSTQVPWLPAEIDNLVGALTARDPDDRPRDADAAAALVSQTRAGLDARTLARRAERPRLPRSTAPFALAEAIQEEPAPDPRQAAGERNTTALRPSRPAVSNGSGDETVRLNLGPRPKQAKSRALVTAGRGVALRHPAKRRLLWIALITLLALVLGGGAVWWFNSGPGAYRLVPDGLVNATQADAQATLAAANLDSTVAKAFDDKVPAGHVVSAAPGENKSIRKDGTVHLVISRGVEMLTLPGDLVGAQQDAATATLTTARFTVSTPKDEYHDTVPAGEVLAVNGPEGALAAGDSIAHNTPITLTVSKGPAPVEVPKLVGATEANASAALGKAGLIPKVTKENSMTVPAGQVISQDPAAGTAAHRRDTVTFVVSLGPPLVALPDTYGLNVKDAKAKLETAGFVVAVRHPQGITPLNLVYNQTPNGGGDKTAPKGSTVTLDVF